MFCLSASAILLRMMMSSDFIDHNNPSLDVREFLSLGGEFPPLGGGESGLDDKSLSPDGVFSHNAKILARSFCDLLEISKSSTLLPALMALQLSGPCSQTDAVQDGQHLAFMVQHHSCRHGLPLLITGPWFFVAVQHPILLWSKMSSKSTPPHQLVQQRA